MSPNFIARFSSFVNKYYYYYYFFFLWGHLTYVFTLTCFALGYTHLDGLVSTSRVKFRHARKLRIFLDAIVYRDLFPDGCGFWNLKETPCHAHTRYIIPFSEYCTRIRSIAAQLFEFIATTGIPSRKSGCVSWAFLLAGNHPRDSRDCVRRNM